MQAPYKTVEELQKLYPDSWVLLEKPISNKKNTRFVGGFFHYKNKNRDKVFEKASKLQLNHITIIYTGGKLDETALNFIL